MNAQEAIENMNRTLNRRISEKERLEPHKDDYPYMYKNASEHVKALSIVLESAKLFHEHTVPDLKRKNSRFGHSGEYRTIYGIPLEKVGIELDEVEGVDE